MKKRNILSVNCLLTAFMIFAAGIFLVLPSETAAATFRNRTAQTPPGNPLNTQTVRIWMESDTAFGETAAVEYKIGGVFTTVYGTFDNTNGPAPANWYADIPAQAGGTVVSYQLLTRNQTGTNYGFTGFNWTYTVQVATAAGVSISGRVVTAKGRGIGKAFVSIVDGNGDMRTVLTNSFGFYGFNDVASGENCLISVTDKNYQFARPAQFLAVSGDLTEVNFTALPK